MTALTTPSRPDSEDDADPRPLPWRRMTGVTWRQHRAALAGMAVLLGALAVVLPAKRPRGVSHRRSDKPR